MTIEHRIGRTTALCAILLVGTAAAVRAQESGEGGSATAVPRIEAVETTVDLGSVVRGEKAEATYRLRNTGGATLEIHKAKPG